MKLKILNGAPLCEHLDFSEASLAGDEQRDVASQEILKVQPLGAHMDEHASATVKWRRLAARDTLLRSGWSQPYLPRGPKSNEDVQFSSVFRVNETSLAPITDASIDGLEPEESDFLQHSLIFHDTLKSSQIEYGLGADNTVSSSSFLNDSFNSALTDVQFNEASIVPTLAFHVPNNLEVMPLIHVPSSRQLQAIHPQTMTPNLLCALVSKAAPREVLVQRGGYRMHLHEISVADETMASFQVTFWFRPTSRDASIQQGIQKDLRTTIEQARVGDILLLRNIALSSFRDQVHGQSLNASIMRAKTTVDILLRGDRPSSFQLHDLPSALEEKLSRVKKWASVHIVPEYVSSRKRKRDSDSKGQTDGGPSRASDPNEDSLPPDTMED